MRASTPHDAAAQSHYNGAIRIAARAPLRAALDARGFATLPGLLDRQSCLDLRALYDDDARFRTTIAMARHGFGEGEYRYFRYPLPPLVESLRQAFYAPLASQANDWNAKLGRDARFPESLDDYLAICAAAGQQRPTPLLLKYEAGGYNCLHQDLYGDLSFPLQVALLLSQPQEDFDGGEFLLVEQRPRAQSRGHVVPLRQGDAVVFANDLRPAAGRRGIVRRRLRHGVSEVTAGIRYTLGLIFHDSA